MEKSTYAVIMAGGSGERFWPMSTPERPKQFVSLFGGKPLLRHAVERLDGLVPPERIFVVTAANLVEASRDACPALPPGNVVGEPCRRDTAAATALACGLVAARDPEAVVLLLTADQLMDSIPVFRRTLADAAGVAASSDSIVTIGIEPTFPATGYGYIECAETLPTGTVTLFCRTRRFVEKPDAARAAEYLARGGFYWNSGMFAWSVRTMARAIAEFAPALAPLLSLPSEASSPEALDAALAAIYPGLVKISIDYAVMEKHRNVLMARGTFGWDDVGSWPSLEKHFPQDACGNTLIGNATTLDSHRNIAVSENGHRIALLGVDDLVVVEVPGTTLVCHKSRAQDLKKLLASVGKGKG